MMGTSSDIDVFYMEAAACGVGMSEVTAHSALSYCLAGITRTPVLVGVHPYMLGLAVY